MKRNPLYSRSDQTRKAPGAGAVAPDGDRPAGQPSPRLSRWRAHCARHERAMLLIAAALVALAIVLGHAALTHAPRAVTQKDIDAAVLHTLETTQMPSHAAKAYEAVRRSVVRVRGTGYAKSEDGYVIGRRRHRRRHRRHRRSSSPTCTSSRAPTGSRSSSATACESEATVIGMRPEHDLAVLQAQEDARRPARRHAALDRRPRRRRRGGRRRLPVRHRPVGRRRAWCPGCGANTARRKASSC